MNERSENARSENTPVPILFDLDGTLVDTPAGMVEVLRTVVAEAGRNAGDDQLRRTIGRPLSAAFGTLLELPTYHPEVTHAANRARELFTTTVIPRSADLVFPGVGELLATLRARGHPLAVVTSKAYRGAVELLTATGLLPAFDTLSCHGMARRGKPHADLALLAADALDVQPETCAVVGDAVDDMRMAVAAGMDPLGVGTGVGTPGELVNSGARLVFPDLTTLGKSLLLETEPRPYETEPRLLTSVASVSVPPGPAER